MLALYLVPLLAASMFYVVLDDEGDDDAVANDDPVQPEIDDIITGTADADTIEATGNEIVNAGEGADILTADGDSDGAVLNGEGGADVLTIEGANGTANGGMGQDTLEAFNQVNAVLNGGDGDDTIRIDGPTGETGTSGTASGGGGEDTITANGVGVTVLGGAGNDVINVQGSMENVSGGSGNDVINVDTADYGGSTTVSGDEGDDRISLNETAGLATLQQANGGAGDDILDTIVYGGGVADILTGGAGADTFEITLNSYDTPAGEGDYGSVAQITDFSVEEDVLMVDLQFIEGADDATTTSSFELVEAEDGSYTDLIFSINTAGTTTPTTGTIRLDGLADLDPADIDFMTTA